MILANYQEIQNAKLFSLTTCPIDELNNDEIKKIVIGFRNNNISISEAFIGLNPMEYYFMEMVSSNRFMNDLIDGEEC
jgi:hypothetical protein